MENIRVVTLIIFPPEISIFLPETGRKLQVNWKGRNDKSRGGNEDFVLPVRSLLSKTNDLYFLL